MMTPSEKAGSSPGKSRRWLGIVLMLLCAVCLCMGQFIWKRWDGWFSLLLGFAVYCLGALSMLIAYRFGSLSVLQPINSVSYVLSTLLGFWVFQERISPLRILGIAAVMAGVFLLARGEREKE